ncbi:unnamed protein product [Symbiodinium microadriaticum]|nr:unnamed protein product [Symbiodinium microadriaticum]CAE7744661.1 unnamed protein product [Symbiodinium sp. KB8]
MAMLGMRLIPNGKSQLTMDEVDGQNTPVLNLELKLQLPVLNLLEVLGQNFIPAMLDPQTVGGKAEDESTKGAEKPDQSESRPASSDPDNLSDDNSPIEANPLWTDDDSQDVAKIWEREQPQEHADVAVGGWQPLPSSTHGDLVRLAKARGAKHDSVDMPMDGSTGSSGSADGRLWLEVVDQLQQMCRSIVSSQRFHVHLLQSQNNMTAKMRDFTLSLGDRMQNLSINMKSQTAGLAQRLETLAQSMSSLETSHASWPRAGGPVGAAPRAGPGRR